MENKEQTKRKLKCSDLAVKIVLFTFNFFFWLAGGAVIAVGVWTLMEKSAYISLLSSNSFSISAWILIVAGTIVMVTGIVGCVAVGMDKTKLLQVYFIMLLCIFILEILAGILAYVYYTQLSDELKQNLKKTMIENYGMPDKERITEAMDTLQKKFKCCGSNRSSDWLETKWIRSASANGRKVPDSCCKTETPSCGVRDHPSNIYKVEGGCITKLEKFILEHLLIIGAVGVGIASVQIIGMLITYFLYRREINKKGKD